MKRTLGRVTRLAGALACTTAVWMVCPAAANDISPTVLASSCTACHGPDGASPGAMPSIAGLEAATMVAKLKDFKSGAQEATVMNRIAKGYSEPEIDALAKYFSVLRK